MLHVGTLSSSPQFFEIDEEPTTVATHPRVCLTCWQSGHPSSSGVTALCLRQDDLTSTTLEGRGSTKVQMRPFSPCLSYSRALFDGRRGSVGLGWSMYIDRGIVPATIVYLELLEIISHWCMISRSSYIHFGNRIHILHWMLPIARGLPHYIPSKYISSDFQRGPSISYKPVTAGRESRRIV